jgi:hypothetical protein
MVLDILTIVKDFAILNQMRNKESEARWATEHPHVTEGVQLVKASDINISYPKPCSIALKAYLDALPNEEFDLLEKIAIAGQTGKWGPFETDQYPRFARQERLAGKIPAGDWVTNGYLQFQEIINSQTKDIIGKASGVNK